MKKIILMLFSLLLMSGCTLFATKSIPTSTVEDFLGDYQSLNQEVVNQLDDVVKNQGLTATQSDDYIRLMKNQYQNLTYKVKDEVVNGDQATVTVEVEVYNLGKEQATVAAYVETNKQQFEDEEGAFSDIKYMDYKINQLKKVSDRIKYDIDFQLTKVNDAWQLDDITDTMRQKINGVYKEA